MLFEYGADCTKMNNHDSVLHCAVASKKTSIVKLIIEKIQEEEHNENFAKFVNVADAEGDTPLMWAAENGLSEIAVLLLQNGAEVNLKNNEGMTALDSAIKCDKKEVVQILLEHVAIASKVTN